MIPSARVSHTAKMDVLIVCVSILVPVSATRVTLLAVLIPVIVNLFVRVTVLTATVLDQMIASVIKGSYGENQTMKQSLMVAAKSLVAVSIPAKVDVETTGFAMLKTERATVFTDGLAKTAGLPRSAGLSATTATRIYSDGEYSC